MTNRPTFKTTLNTFSLSSREYEFYPCWIGSVGLISIVSAIIRFARNISWWRWWWVFFWPDFNYPNLCLWIFPKNGLLLILFMSNAKYSNLVHLFQHGVNEENCERKKNHLIYFLFCIWTVALLNRTLQFKYGIRKKKNLFLKKILNIGLRHFNHRKRLWVI